MGIGTGAEGGVGKVVAVFIRPYISAIFLILSLSTVVDVGRIIANCLARDVDPDGGTVERELEVGIGIGLVGRRGSKVSVIVIPFIRFSIVDLSSNLDLGMIVMMGILVDILDFRSRRIPCFIP